MEVTRKLQKVGGSVVLTIPAEIARELALEAGSEVRLTSGEGHIRVEPAAPRPSSEVVEFMQHFMGKYDQALRNLADR